MAWNCTIPKNPIKGHHFSSARVLHLCSAQCALFLRVASFKAARCTMWARIIGEKNWKKISIYIAVIYQNHVSKLFWNFWYHVSKNFSLHFETYLYNLGQLHSEYLVVRFWVREARWQLVKLPMAENWYRANNFLHPPIHHRDPTIWQFELVKTIVCSGMYIEPANTWRNHVLSCGWWW